MYPRASRLLIRRYPHIASRFPCALRAHLDCTLCTPGRLPPAPGPARMLTTIPPFQPSCHPQHVQYPSASALGNPGGGAQANVEPDSIINSLGHPLNSSDACEQSGFPLQHAPNLRPEPLSSDPHCGPHTHNPSYFLCDILHLTSTIPPVTANTTQPCGTHWGSTSPPWPPPTHT